MDRRLFFLLHRTPRALLAHANGSALEALGESSAQLAILFLTDHGAAQDDIRRRVENYDA